MGVITINERKFNSTDYLEASGVGFGATGVSYNVTFSWEDDGIEDADLTGQSIITSATVKSGWEKLPIGMADADVLEMEVIPYTIIEEDIRDSFIRQCITGSLEAVLQLTVTFGGSPISTARRFRLQRSNTTDITLRDMEAKTAKLKLSFLAKWRSLLEELPPLYKRNTLGVPILAATETTTTGSQNSRMIDFFPAAYTDPIGLPFPELWSRTKIAATSYYSAPSTLGSTVKTVPLWTAVSEPLTWAGIFIGSASTAFDDLIAGVVDTDQGGNVSTLNTLPVETTSITGTQVHVITEEPLGRSPVTQWASEFKNGYEFTRSFFEAFDFTCAVVGDDLAFFDSEGTPFSSPIERLSSSVELSIGALTVGRASVSVRHQPASGTDPSEFIASNETPSLAEEEFSVKMPFHDVITSGGFGGVHVFETTDQSFAIKDMNVFRMFGYTAGGYLGYFRPTEFRGVTILDRTPAEFGGGDLGYFVNEINNTSLPNLLCQRIVSKYGVAHALSATSVGLDWLNYIGSVFEGF